LTKLQPPIQRLTFLAHSVLITGKPDIHNGGLAPG